MKNLLTFFLLLFVNLSFGQDIIELNQLPDFNSYDDFEVREGLIFRKNSKYPYSGDITTYYDQGAVRIKGKSSNGKQIGWWEMYQDTIYEKEIIETIAIPVERDSEEVKVIAKTRNCVAGYTFHDESGVAVYSFNKDGTYTFSTSFFGGMYHSGNWIILNDDFHQRIVAQPNKGSEKNLPIDIDLYLWSCDQLRLGDTYYNKRINNDNNLTESLEESLAASKYYNTYQKNRVVKPVQSSYLIYGIHYNTRQGIIEYKNREGCITSFNQPTPRGVVTKSTTCRDNYYVDYNYFGHIISLGKLQNHDRIGPCLIYENEPHSSYGNSNRLLARPSYYQIFNDEYKNSYKQNSWMINSNKEIPTFFKKNNENGEIIMDLKTNRIGIIISGFWYISGAGQGKTKIEITSKPYYGVFGNEDASLRKFKEYKIVQTGYNDGEKIQYVVESVFTSDWESDRKHNGAHKRPYDQSLYQQYQEFYSNGNLKKQLSFQKDYYFRGFPHKSDTFIDDKKASEWFDRLTRSVFYQSTGYKLFRGKQLVFYENGELKYSVKFGNARNDKKCLNKVKEEDLDRKQHYVYHEENYFTYIGDGHEYNENGKKIGKIYWDQYGRICDKNGKIIIDTVLNVSINKFNYFLK